MIYGIKNIQKQAKCPVLTTDMDVTSDSSSHDQSGV